MSLPLAVVWSEVAQQVTSGLAAGAIYASLALALVLIYQTTNVVNFAQGEMATFTTFICWSLMNHGLSFWAAFPIVLVWMAWRTALTRSMESATGLLYINFAAVLAGTIGAAALYVSSGILV